MGSSSVLQWLVAGMWVAVVCGLGTFCQGCEFCGAVRHKREESLGLRQTPWMTVESSNSVCG